MRSLNFSCNLTNCLIWKRVKCPPNLSLPTMHKTWQCNVLWGQVNKLPTGCLMYVCLDFTNHAITILCSWNLKKHHVSSKRLTENILQYMYLHVPTHLFKNVIDTVYGLRSISKWVTISDMLRMCPLSNYLSFSRWNNHLTHVTSIQSKRGTIKLASESLKEK